MKRRFAPVVLLISFAACAAPQVATTRTPMAAFDKLAEETLYGSLALSPVGATQAGYHQHNGVELDAQIDDFSAAGLEAQGRFWEDVKKRVGELDPKSLDVEQQADRDVLTNQIELALLELKTLQSYKHNPTVYVELAGNAVFAPYMLNYAAKDKRFLHIIGRLEKFPALFAQARANLTDSPEVWNRVAREENDGNIALIDQTLRREVPPAQKSEYDRAARSALAALRDFNAYLSNELSKKTSDWRLGKERYAAKCEYALATGKTPEQLLAEAEDALKSTRNELEQLAKPKSPREALDEVARQHATAATYMAEAKRSLAQATAFVKEKGLVTLPGRGNLEVIDTPEFVRGIYAVGGFNAAPPLEPELGAFYWVTPIPKTWPADRVDS
jgi:uncharacterized protein (DUF885 family)